MNKGRVLTEVSLEAVIESAYREIYTMVFAWFRVTSPQKIVVKGD
jgi:hypothetical protein